MAKRLQITETESLDTLLLSVVDETMTKVFREAGANVIYDYLANKHHLRREEIVKKPEVFSSGLKRLLSSAAPVIENLILNNLYCKLGLRFWEKRSYEFSDYIEELKGAVVEA